MYSAIKGREDLLSERFAVRIELLLGEGYAVLVPDSFGSRGRREVCTIKIGENPVTPTRRRLDALGALAYLSGRTEIARDRVALVGWSHGGSAALATINARDREVAAFRDKPGAPPFFRAAVAFYPGCTVSSARPSAGNRRCRRAFTSARPTTGRRQGLASSWAKRWSRAASRSR